MNRALFRVFAAVMTLAVANVFAAPAAAAPPPPGGLTPVRSTPTPTPAPTPLQISLSCRPGFAVTKGLYASTYLCISSPVGCPLGYNLDASNLPHTALGTQNKPHFVWFCVSNGSIPPSSALATCGIGTRGDPIDANYAHYFCFVGLLTCSPVYKLKADNDNEWGVEPGLPAKFYYTCANINLQ